MPVARRRLVAALAPLTLTGASVADTPTPAKPKLAGCVPFAVDRATPLGAGPLRLKAAYCGIMGDADLPSQMALSPDGRSVLAADDRTGVWITTLDRFGTPRRIALSLSINHAGSFQPAFAWAADSRGIWGVDQRVVVPNGWAIDPLRTLSMSVDGRRTNLPRLVSPAGGMDGIIWAGNGGLGIATFGTAGDYYRPERRDRDPTIAMIDARRGHILQTMRLVRSGEVPPRRLLDGTAIVDRRGRIHALLKLGPHNWVLWIQGQLPRPVELPVDRSSVPNFALSPDGFRVLRSPGLSATGVICERNPNCPPPIPQTGVAAELREVETGKLVWRISRTATRLSSTYRPVVSPDGRYALISMPAEDGYAEGVALVSMRDGAILQRLGELPPSMGFGADNRTVWTAWSSRLAIYDLR